MASEASSEESCEPFIARVVGLDMVCAGAWGCGGWSAEINVGAATRILQSMDQMNSLIIVFIEIIFVCIPVSLSLARVEVPVSTG
jgi:hypothetical protein